MKLGMNILPLEINPLSFIQYVLVATQAYKFCASTDFKKYKTSVLILFL
jgi:hypothetical protein